MPSPFFFGSNPCLRALLLLLRSYKEPSFLGGLYKVVSRPAESDGSDEDSDLESAPKRAAVVRRGRPAQGGGGGASQAKRGSPSSSQLNTTTSDSLFGAPKITRRLQLAIESLLGSYFLILCVSPELQALCGTSQAPYPWPSPSGGKTTSHPRMRP